MVGRPRGQPWSVPRKAGVHGCRWVHDIAHETGGPRRCRPAQGRPADNRERRKGGTGNKWRAADWSPHRLWQDSRPRPRRLTPLPIVALRGWTLRSRKVGPTEQNRERVLQATMRPAVAGRSSNARNSCNGCDECVFQYILLPSPHQTSSRTQSASFGLSIETAPPPPSTYRSTNGSVVATVHTGNAHHVRISTRST